MELRCLLGGILLAASGFSAMAAEPIVLRFSSTLPSSADIVVDAFRPWIESVEQQLDGEVRIELFAGGSLGRHTQAYLQMVRDGVVDFSLFLPSYYPGEFPDNDMFQLPLMFDNSMEASLTAWRMVQKNMLRGLDGVHVTAIYATLPYGLHLNFPYHSLDDLAGRKIRTMGLIQKRVADALGATPIGNIIASNLAETMGRGLVDGALLGWDNMRAFGVRNVSDHHVEAPVTLSLAILGMNPESYARLPPRTRAVLDATAGEQLIRTVIDITSAAGDEVRAEAAASGEHTLIDPDADEMRAYRSRLSGISDFYTQREPGNAERYRVFLETLDEVRRLEAARLNDPKAQ